MGDPKKTRKKYETPRHPWSGTRIAEEKVLVREFGLRNKREIYKMGTTLKSFKDRAKRLIAQQGAQADRERQQMLDRMTRLGLIKQGATFDDILGLGLNDLMARRLQTLMLKKHLARSPKQARQMITHRHVTVDGQVVTSPSALVTVAQEAAIGFVARSPFMNEQHAERFSEEELAKKQAREDAKKGKGDKKDSDVIAFDEKDIEEAEVLAGEKLKSEAKAAEEKPEKPAEPKQEAPAEPAKDEKPAENAPEDAEKPAEQAAKPAEKRTEAKE